MMELIPSAVNGMCVADLERIKSICRGVFPLAKQVSISTLVEWMSTPDSSLLLIDVRSSEEFAVSQLPGAVNLRNLGEIKEALNRTGATRTVLYCSVGFRSSRLAAQLVGEHPGTIMNLEGSIFEWANRGLPLFQGQLETHKVHPFGKRWEGLLKEGLSEFTP